MELFQDEDLVKIQNEKKSATEYRERRVTEWNDNYILWRNRVITNRLTQRQSANIPLTKEVLSTIMKDIDDELITYFRDKGNDEQKEIYYNEYWKKNMEKNQDFIKMLVHKRQSLLFGRSFRKLNVKNGLFTYELIDPQNILVDKHIDPTNIDSTRSIIQTGIYQTLEEIINNDKFLAEGRNTLKRYYSETNTEELDTDNYQNYTDREERLKDLGYNSEMTPEVGATYVELNEVIRLEGSQFILYVVATIEEGLVKLLKKPLDEVIGKTSDNFWKEHLPITSLSTEHDLTDFWNDGPADIVRPSNVIVNSWISQEVENRTLKNFSMHYYDSSNEKFIPQTYNPEAWGWYPVPGKPSDVIQDVSVPDLSSSLNEIQYILNIAKGAVGATGTNAGQLDDRKVTLGEIQITVANAQERTKSFVPLIQDEMKEFGIKYIKMLEAQKNNLTEIEISKLGRNGKKLYSKTIRPDMIYSPKGWEIEVQTRNDKMTDAVSNIQKLDVATQEMPNNLPLREIKKKKLLEFAGLNSDEMQLVLDAEKQNTLQNVMQPTMTPEGTVPQETTMEQPVPNLPIQNEPIGQTA